MNVVDKRPIALLRGRPGKDNGTLSPTTTTLLKRGFQPEPHPRKSGRINLPKVAVWPFGLGFLEPSERPIEKAGFIVLGLFLWAFGNDLSTLFIVEASPPPCGLPVDFRHLLP